LDGAVRGGGRPQEGQLVCTGVWLSLLLYIPPDGTGPSRGQHVSGVRIHCPPERGVRGMLPQPNGKGSRIKTAAQTTAEQRLIAVLAKNLCPRGAALQSSLWTTIRGTNAKGAR
jgi:hypothetical protein